MLIINMLIPDLLNVLFDQCNYENMTMLRSLNKRRTNYANKYSLLRYYDFETNTIKSMCERGNIKAIEHIILHWSGGRDDTLRYHHAYHHTCRSGVCACDDMLGWGAKNGHVLVVKYLANVVGANIHAFDDHALRMSAENGYISVVKYLISIGANVHANGDGALQWSAFNGHLEVVKYLIGIGVNIRVDNDDALRWSARRGHLEVVKCLVGAGANIHALDDYALEWSANNGHLEVVKYLISVGANIRAGNGHLLNFKMIKDNFSHLFV